jgi:hypothetical protein
VDLSADRPRWGPLGSRLSADRQRRYPIAPRPDQHDEPAPDDHDGLRLRKLPPEIGTLLMIVGIAGLLLPGPVGSPFVIAGGITLWPSALGRVDGWFRRRFPKAHRDGMTQIARFLDDLEHRYPGSLDER